MARRRSGSRPKHNKQQKKAKPSKTVVASSVSAIPKQPKHSEDESTTKINRENPKNIEVDENVDKKNITIFSEDMKIDDIIIPSKHNSIDPELFNKIAQHFAKMIASNKGSNKTTQLRKFYDEIVMWDQKVSSHSDKFDEYLPFILMLNAKVAYAKGRKNLVDLNFQLLMNRCLEQVEDKHSMHTFKTFMEAFMGFYKVERPRD